jgi:PST family polysaccharide transporter
MLRRLLGTIYMRAQARLEGRPQARRILENAAWLFGDRALKGCVSIFVGAWVARYLGADAYGLLNYAIALCALVGPLGTLGLQNVVIRDIVEYPDKAAVTLGTAFVLRLIGSVLGAVTIYCAVVALRPGDRMAHVAVALLALSAIAQALWVIAWWFESQVRSKHVVIADNIVFLSGAVLRVVLILVGAPLLAFVVLIAAEVAVSGIGLTLAYRWCGQRIAEWSARARTAKALFAKSWPFMLTGAAITIYMKIDLVMLGDMLGNREAGVYAAALRLSEPWYLIPSAITGSAFPALVKMRREGRARYVVQVSKLCRSLSLVAYFIAIPITVFATPLIQMVFGTAYAEAGTVLAVHIWACHAVFLGVAYNYWIAAENLPLFSLVATIAGAILNFALNVLMIPRYGPLGAAIATVLSYMFVIFVMPFATSRTRPMAWLLLKALWPFATWREQS